MNKKGVFLVLSSLLIYFYPMAIAESGRAVVEFTTYPMEPQNFQPFYQGNQPAKVTIEVKDAATGNPLRDVRVELSITHLKGRGILNTGFPYIEGKETLGGNFFAPEGKLEIEYLFPVRGNYEVEVLAAPSSSSQPRFEPVSGIFRVHVREPFFEVRNAAVLITLLFILGLFLGRIYARAAVAIVLLILVVLPGAQALKSENARAEISFEPLPQVGVPSKVYLEIRDAATGRAIPNVQLSLQVIVPHAGATMFSGNFYSPDGKLEFLYNFQDADAHVLTIGASPTEMTPPEFKPFSESYVVEVAPPEEPRGIWMKTWSMLMGVVLAGIGTGYFATKRLM